MEIGWVEITPGRQAGWEPVESLFAQPVGDGWHAQFASLVRIRPMSELSKRKWGFNLGALLEEAVDRQRQFIESRHFSRELNAEDEPPERRTIALRAIRRPGCPSIHLALLAKVWAPSMEAARQAASEHFDDIHASFPTDYELIPARTPEVFRSLAGWDLLQTAAHPKAIAEIQRYEWVLRAANTPLYLLGAWKFNNTSNEQIWRALYNTDRAVLFNVTLRPTLLDEREQNALLVIARFAEQLAEQPTPPQVKYYAEFAAKNYANLLQQLRRPYLVQTHVLAPDGLPEYLPRLIGSAVTHRAAGEAATPGFDVIYPLDPLQASKWCANLAWLETDVGTTPVIDARFVRVRKMSDAHEARGLFALPFPPESGLPDVTFAETLENLV